MGIRRTWIVAASLIAGVLLADKFRPSFVASAAIGALGVLLFLASWFVHRRSQLDRSAPRPGEPLPKMSSFVSACVLAGVAFIGFCNLGSRSAAMEKSPFTQEPRALEVEGTVVRDPFPVGKAQRVELKTDNIDGAPSKWRVSARIFGAAALGNDLMVGDRVRLGGKFRELSAKDRFDRALLRRGVVAEGTISSTDLQKVGRARGLLAIANYIRTSMRNLTANLSQGQSGLVLGLTIGDDAALPERLREDMRTTGLTHLTAVSGANVAIVLAAVVVLLRLIGSSRRVLVTACLLVILMFVLVARWEPSVLRASLTAALALIAYWIGRHSSPFNTAGVTFIGLVSIDPNIAWSIGFQLSFAATLGILILASPLKDRFRKVRLMPEWARTAFSVGLAAQIVVTPLIAFHFGRFSIVSPLANLVAFPLVAPVTILGMTGGLLGSVWTPAGIPLVAAAALFASGLELVASSFAALPLASVGAPDIGLPTLLSIYALIAASAAWLTTKKHPARRVVFVVVLVWIVFSITPASSSTPEGLEVRFFDVGQGESALIRSPGGARVLIDGGPDEDLVANRLAQLAVNRLDLVVFSHAHADHILGLEEVLDEVVVRLSIYPGVGRIFRGPSSDDLRAVDSVGDGEEFVIGDLRVSILGPPADLLQYARDEVGSGEGSGLNDASVVVRLQWRDSCILFTGDVEEVGQEALLAKHRQQIDCEVMKAPHHGSPRIVEEFVKAVDPELVVVSVGRNDYGHPSRKALSMFGRSGAQVLRTDRLGDIVVVIDEQGRIEL